MINLIKNDEFHIKSLFLMVLERKVIQKLQTILYKKKRCLGIALVADVSNFTNGAF